MDESKLRSGRLPVTLPIEPRLWQRVKVEAVKRELKYNQAVELALQEWLSNHAGERGQG